jgi:hypothetical protein
MSDQENTVTAGGHGFPGENVEAKPENPLAFASQGPDGGQYGMTLRDYFAAKIMAGFMACDLDGASAEDVDAEYHAKHAYRVADAMLKVRSA